MRVPRFVWIVLATCLIGVSPAWAGLDPDVLEALETELSTPICGVGYLDTRMDQLEATVPRADTVAYLDQLARAEPPTQDDDVRRYLPTLSIDLLARLAATPGDDRARPAREALLRLHTTFAADAEAEHLERLVSRQLAALGDPVGLELLLGDLASDSVQVRADTFSALLPLVEAEAALAERLAPLATDVDSYVVSRVVWDLDANAPARNAVLAALDALEAGGTLDDDQLGRAAVVRVALGAADADQAARAEGWLAHYGGPFDAELLDELGALSRLLVVRGDALGLRAAVHLASLYAEPGVMASGHATNTAIGVFTQFTGFELDEADHYKPRAQAAAVAAWYEAHADDLEFDAAEHRWR